MLAVVIPFFKIKFLSNCLQSLAAQTDQRFRVYIGNDASPEDPEELINYYRTKLDLVYVRFEENIGGVCLVKQWERCLNLVQDESWIMILGDDDVLTSTCFSDFYKHLKEINFREINVVRFASAHINSKGDLTSGIYTHPEVEDSVDFLFRKIKGKTRSSLSEYIFRKRQVEEVGFRHFPLAWFTDLLGVLEFSNFKIVYSINSSIVYFRFSTLNISGKTNDSKIKNYATFKFYKYLLKEKESNFNQKQLRILRIMLEKSILAHKKNVILFLKFTRFYLLKKWYKPYLKFFIRNVRSVLSTKN